MRLLKVFFYRTHVKWNHIPLVIKEAVSITEFKSKLTVHMWKNIISELKDDLLDDNA